MRKMKTITIRAANLSVNRANLRQVLDCAGRAKRRRRFGLSRNGQGIAKLRRASSAESKAAWRFASRRTPKRLHVGECAPPKPWRLSMNRKMPGLEMNKLQILRFMVPMHSKKRKGALHEPTVWSPGFSRSGRPEGGTPYRWRAPARFMVPLHARQRKEAFHEP
jgi:hypothetical protein